MSLAERDLGTPSVSLGELLAGARPELVGSTGKTLETYAQEIVASGFPGIRALAPLARRLQLDGYLRRLAERDFESVGHLRTKAGRQEIDLIVERAGRVVAIEVKLAATVSDDDVRHLHWLSRQIGDELADAIVVTTGREAYRRTDGIGVVPASLLGP